MTRSQTSEKPASEPVAEAKSEETEVAAKPRLSRLSSSGGAGGIALMGITAADLANKLKPASTPSISNSKTKDSNEEKNEQGEAKKEDAKPAPVVEPKKDEPKPAEEKKEEPKPAEAPKVEEKKEEATAPPPKEEPKKMGLAARFGFGKKTEKKETEEKKAEEPPKASGVKGLFGSKKTEEPAKPAAATKPADKPAETKPADPKPAEPKPGDAKAIDISADEKEIRTWIDTLLKTAVFDASKDLKSNLHDGHILCK